LFVPDPKYQAVQLLKRRGQWIFKTPAIQQVEIYCRVNVGPLLASQNVAESQPAMSRDRIRHRTTPSPDLAFGYDFVPQGSNEAAPWTV
jgi:hypothetical protein